MENGEGSQNFSSSNAGAAPVNTPSSTPPASEERTFRQSEVNDIIGKARAEAVDRYKRETSMPSHNPNYGYQPQQQPQNQPPQQGYGQQQPYQPQQRQLSEDDVKRMAAEESRRSREEWIQDQRRNAEEQNAQRIASEFFTKVGAGDGGMKEFEKTVADSGIDLRTIPYHVQLANMVDNTREVMVELLKNPTKVGSIQSLIDIDLRAGRQPNLALAEIKKLSESIKSNQSAGKFQSPNEPLSQLRPSNAGTGNQGALTVGDYKRKYRV
jgi:hypothetical protein